MAAWPALPEVAVAVGDELGDAVPSAPFPAGSWYISVWAGISTSPAAAASAWSHCGETGTEGWPEVTLPCTVTPGAKAASRFVSMPRMMTRPQWAPASAEMSLADMFVSSESITRVESAPELWTAPPAEVSVV